MAEPAAGRTTATFTPPTISLSRGTIRHRHLATGSGVSIGSTYPLVQQAREGARRRRTPTRALR
eukprot:6213240-Pleurochrysis_carterae.AAC.2